MINEIILNVKDRNIVDFLCGFSTYRQSNGKYYKKEDVDDHRGHLELLSPVTKTEAKGMIEILWNMFGRRVNKSGKKYVDCNIIMLETGTVGYVETFNDTKLKEITRKLKEKGFNLDNIKIQLNHE